ncbi:MAG: hypothetical protein DRQ88_03090 [Epsilonproteobacteria bacterium]|nr:MAG: hypothetical protein DRQ89_02045 [Campylobacterota bacterium]RLA67457.1 MAG: hypothetical protein DRQ88_03090 [Campylobacterota bacterium]
MKIFPLLLFLFSAQVWGCPGCLATSKTGSSDVTVYILGIFILLCYIPLYSLFKTIIKYKNINNT